MPDDSHPIFIPAWVAGDRRLSLPQKCLMGRIYILAKTTGWCWASNATLGKDLGTAGKPHMSERQTRANVQVLKTCGHLSTEGAGSLRKLRPMVPELQTLMGLTGDPAEKRHVGELPSQKPPHTRPKTAADKERGTREIDVEETWKVVDDFVAHRRRVDSQLVAPEVWEWIHDRGGIPGLRALSPKDYTWAIRTFRSTFAC